MEYRVGGAMQQGRLGCFGLIGVAIALALLWKLTLYIGVPLAIAGGVTANILYRKASEEEDYERVAEQQKLALTVALSSAFLLIAAILGNVFTNDGPFGKSDGSATEPGSVTQKPTIDTPTNHRDYAVDEPTDAERRKVKAAVDRCEMEARGYDDTSAVIPYGGLTVTPKQNVYLTCMDRSGVSYLIKRYGHDAF